MSVHADKLAEAEHLLDELERMQLQLQQLQEGVTRSHRLATLGTMASIIAHEFNNLLTPMISYCQLARKSPDDAQLARKAIDKALAGATRAAEISSSMLGFARDGDGDDLARVASVIDDVFNCLARDPKKDGIELRLDVADPLWAAIAPVALQQVVLNLVLNARQAMRPKGGQLHIIARADGDTVRITVADTGPGIPPQMLDHLFEPFVTRRDGPAGEPKGTGLGLTVCRDLITRADGSIEVDSSPGMGATFRITLPAATKPSSGSASDPDPGRDRRPGPVSPPGCSA